MDTTQAKRPNLAQTLDEAFLKVLVEELTGAVVESPVEPSSALEQTIHDGIAFRAEEPASRPPPTPRPQKRREPAGADTPIHLPSGVPLMTIRWQLRVHIPDRPECVLPLESTPITIGRGRKNSIAVNCQRVSRYHARFWLDDTSPRVKDVGSLNGTRVNGTQVPDARLQAGDVIELGSIKILVECKDRSGSHPA